MAAQGSVAEVFGAFLKLGLTSFGGPIAHLGYFRDELVRRRRWVDDRTYADLVALCQFLPGPASSQTGFALGWLRAGPLGGLAAWLGFTLPSALLMLVFAYGAASLNGPLAEGVLHGLKLVAVAVVAQAVFGMARSLTPDKERAGIALVALLAVTLVGGAFGQLGAIAAGAVLGLIVCQPEARVTATDADFRIAPLFGWAALGLFALLFLVLPLLAGLGQGVALFDAFYRAGAMVFGGGHVVLPLLETETVARGWVTPDGFISGYGAAQAVPGPLFAFAAYLGAVSLPPPNGVLGAIIALVAIFLPGLLLVVGALPFWNRIRGVPAAQAALQGTNAAVVGLLGAALYDPVFVSAVASPLDFALAVGGVVALMVFRLPSWAVVVGLAGIGGVAGVVGAGG